uniref:Expansin-like EG45 domain-containing protein n=1 Tax=Triticum urartu TaxID=4572 RepID=A0A8R7K0R2_TRIUA
MAPLSSKAVALVALSSLLVTYASAGAGNFNDSAFTADPNWEDARATWYGAPTGAGPDDDGGACGFKNTNQYPFSSMTSCGNEPIFKDGKGCGSCYQIRCTNDQSCSGNPETVVITDMNYYPVAKYHFDLSGTAFGAMAKPGLSEKLRHSGIIWNHGMHWLDLVSVLSWIVLHGYVLPRRFLIKVKVGSSIGCHVGVVVHVCVEYVGGIWRRGTFACALPRPLSLYQCVSRP